MKHCREKAVKEKANERLLHSGKANKEYASPSVSPLDPEWVWFL